MAWRSAAHRSGWSRPRSCWRCRPWSPRERSSFSPPCEDIRAVERYLARNGFLILKFFLHVSREEQRRRFLERLEKPEKLWKFLGQGRGRASLLGRLLASVRGGDPGDRLHACPLARRARGSQVVQRLVVAAAIVDALSDLDLSYPKVDRARTAELRRARGLLLRER